MCFQNLLCWLHFQMCNSLELTFLRLEYMLENKSPLGYPPHHMWCPNNLLFHCKGI